MATHLKGRGALTQPPGRFDKLTRTFEQDGWYEEEAAGKHETIVLPEPARSIISRNSASLSRGTWCTATKGRLTNTGREAEVKRRRRLSSTTLAAATPLKPLSGR